VLHALAACRAGHCIELVKRYTGGVKTYTIGQRAVKPCVVAQKPQWPAGDAFPSRGR
jgi:hypothetical protein